MPVLVDTSMWSLLLRRKSGDLGSVEKNMVDELTDLIRRGEARLIGPTRQELLSGVREERQFERLKDNLRAFDDQRLDTADYERAAQFSNKCRGSGIAGSSVDLLICAVAIDRGWPIFTTDYDFAGYARVLPFRLHKSLHTA